MPTVHECDGHRPPLQKKDAATDRRDKWDERELIPPLLAGRFVLPDTPKTGQILQAPDFP